MQKVAMVIIPFKDQLQLHCRRNIGIRIVFLNYILPNNWRSLEKHLKKRNRVALRVMKKVLQLIGLQ
jgi:guanylate kinase